MKILMTADAVGGVWSYALDLADALAPHGVAVELATMGRPLDADQRAQLARSAVCDLHESAFALEWEDDPWDDVDRAGRWLLELEERVRPDLVHLNGYAHGSLPWRTAVVIVAHSDVLSWWEAVTGGPAPAEWERYRLAVEAGLRAATAVCAPTLGMLDAFERHYSFRTERAVVHNGRAWPHPPREKEPFVLSLGRLWDDAKNVAALERVRGRSPWPVVLAGSGSPLGRLPEAEIASYVSRAAVYAAPARYEPFGIAALEAAHAGCALVLGDIATLREVWGDSALFVPPDDDDALLAALRLVARDDELRRELAHRAHRRAQRYTPERMAAGYLQLYERARSRVPA
jgi:glycogen(starch) synthase